MKKTNKNNTLSPEQYIRQKARTLPLGQCYMNKNWFISGIATAVVCRCHKKGTYTFGVFQFDTFCTGLIDCKVEFSRDQESYNNILAYLRDSFKIEPVTYQEVHNLIYGAIAYGEDAGFTPPVMFNLAKFLLEEDTEDIPLINYQFGRFGKHFLLADSEQELDEFMPHLIAHLGKENVLFGIEGSDRYFKGEDFYDSETRKAMRQIASKIREQKQMPIETYSYVHPAYPTQLTLKNEVVGEVLYNPANRLVLSNEQLDQLLALPENELREDLEHVIMYELGRTCDVIPSVDVNEMHSALIHSLILLGQLGNKDSLSVVLESLCQSKDFYDYHLGIIINETYVPTLYNLGKDQLDKLYEFLQIPGLYTYARYLIFPTMVQIAEREPSRRGEVIEWFRKVLQFYAANLSDNHCCDGTLIGLLTTDLLKLKAEELLPELKVLYATGKVDEQCCGSYENVESMMKQPKPYSIQYQFEVHERYEALSKGYAQLVSAHNNLILELMQKKAAEEDAMANAQTADPSEAKTSKVSDTDMVEDAQVIEEVKDEVSLPTEKAPAKKKRATSKKVAKDTEEVADETKEEIAVSEAKKPRTTRTKKASSKAVATSDETSDETSKPAKPKRTTKAKATKVTGEDEPVKAKKPRATKAKATTTATDAE